MDISLGTRSSLRGLAARWAGFFLLGWLVFATAPCVMAYDASATDPCSDCPHCPVEPCHEATANDCDHPLDIPRAADTQPLSAIAFDNGLWQLAGRPHTVSPEPRHTPPDRAGPRAHLLHLRFDE